MKQKILIIRFSSFGDIIQALSIPSALKKRFPESQIHWVTLSQFQEFPSLHKYVDKVFSLNKKEGGQGLKKLNEDLKKENYTHIYDAHNNLRSMMICWALRGFLGWKSLFKKQYFLRRSRYPLRRFMLFKFHINLYPKPFVGQWALLEPLQKWGVSLELPSPPQVSLLESARNKAQKIFLENKKKRPHIAISPSASYELKRWPIEHWKSLLRLAPEWQFYLLGGPEDHFIEDVHKHSPLNTVNLAGQLSFQESSAVIDKCDLIISADTGLMHIGEQLGKPCVALMGPAPFGYPGGKKTKILELDLDCRPCSKHGQGPCVNSVHQKCLVEISPEQVFTEAKKLLSTYRLI